MPTRITDNEPKKETEGSRRDIFRTEKEDNPYAPSGARNINLPEKDTGFKVPAKEEPKVEKENINNPYAPKPAANNPYAPTPKEENISNNPYAPKPATNNPYAPAPKEDNPYMPKD